MTLGESRMRSIQRQHGLGLWGWITVLALIGFFATITLRLVPMYLNEMKIMRVVKATAQDPGNASLGPTELRKAMELRWDIEDIHTIKVTDVKIVRVGGGRALTYDYESRANVFQNIYVVVHFTNRFQMKGGGSVE